MSCLQYHEFDTFLKSEVHHLLSVSFSLVSEVLLSTQLLSFSLSKLSSCSMVSSYAHVKLLHLMSFLKSFDLLASIFMFGFSGYFV